MIRRGDIEWVQVCASDVSSMIADDRDALFVNFLEHGVVGAGVS